MTAKRGSWGIAALTVVLTVAAPVVATIDGYRLALASDVFIWGITLAFMVTGHLIATRQPGNAIGWLFLGVGASAALGGLAGAYADYFVETGAGSKALGQTAAWYGELSWMPFILVPATFLLLLFPDGHLLTPRWRVIAWAAGAGIIGNFAAEGRIPERSRTSRELGNPYAVDSLAREVLAVLVVLALVVGLIGSAASVVLRFRRARGEQRQQMKWIAYAGALAAASIVVMVPLYEVVGERVANATMMLSIIGLPVATAVAILRYRLYDIDVVINRTLVYGSLTATLAGVYVGSVLLLQLALSGLTEGRGSRWRRRRWRSRHCSGRCEAGSSSIVDRRFFRSRYDAAQTIELFGARLRDEVDLAALSADLQAVVVETMRPAHVSLWLRTPGATHERRRSRLALGLAVLALAITVAAAVVSLTAAIGWRSRRTRSSGRSRSSSWSRAM